MKSLLNTIKYQFGSTQNKPVNNGRTKLCNLNPQENPVISVSRQHTAFTSRDYWIRVGLSDLLV